MRQTLLKSGSLKSQIPDDGQAHALFIFMNAYEIVFMEHSSQKNENRAYPLKGYRILDLTTFLSGPFCTQILADLGAEVVKIEPPEGDLSRSVPPYFIGEDSAYFFSANRGKKSVAVDIKQPDGLNLVRGLINVADVVVENFRPGVAARLGLDVDTIRGERPEIIWASISGFGQTGPWKDKPAYDMIVQALSGTMSLTGEPGRPAVRLGIPAGDIVAGMYTAIAINAALADRERSGHGRFIDVAMLDGLLAMLSYQSSYALFSGTSPQRQGARHDSIPTYRSFVGSDDEELVVTANTERMWKGLCKALALSELIEDERFRTPRDRLNNKDALWKILEAAFLTKPAAVWVEKLEEYEVPTALIKSVPQALDDARAAGRNMIISFEAANEQGTDTKVEVVGDPIKFPGAEVSLPTSPPSLGSANERILKEWLGMSELNVEELRAKSIIHCRPSSATKSK